MGSTPTAGTMHVNDLPTPALLVDIHAFDRNVATMAARWPGLALRPHVKAFKSTALAARLAENGHRAFCCATVREMAGMAAAGLGDDVDDVGVAGGHPQQPLAASAQDDRRVWLLHRPRRECRFVEAIELALEAERLLRP